MQRKRRQLGAKLLRVGEATKYGAPSGRRQRGSETEKRGQRQGERPDPERQHGVHSSADSYTHRARGQKALQNRNATPGVQLHLASGQRAAVGRRSSGHTALSRCRPWAGGLWAKTAPDHLHFLSQ